MLLMAASILAIRLLVPHHHVVAFRSPCRQHFAHSFPTHGGFDHVLYVGDVDSETCGLLPVDGEVEIGLAGITIQLHIGDAGHLLHDVRYLVALLLDGSQVIPEDLQGKLALGAGERFSDVVFNRLRKIPGRPR